MEPVQDSQLIQHLNLKQAKTGAFQFCGPAYQSWSVDVAADQAINLYPEYIESGTGKNRIALYGTPGISLLCTLGGGPIRGLWAGENSLYVVSGPTLYQVFYNGTYTNLGTIANDGNPVSMAANGAGSQLVIASGAPAATTNYTDLVIIGLVNGGTANEVASSAHPFTALQGTNQTLVITGGTGFIPNNYVIRSVDGNGRATLSGICGSVGDTGGTGNLTVSTGMLYCDSGTGPVAQRFSVQYTDLAIDPVNNNYVTSASQPFSALTDDGYTLNVTGGTGFTVGTYTINSVFADGTAVLSSAVGTVGSVAGYATELLGYVPAVQVAYLDTFFIVMAGYNSRLFYISASDDGTSWNPLQVVEKTSYPDNINAILSDHENLWLFGSEESTEPWQNVGGAVIPFARNNSGVLHYGIEAPFSVGRLQQGFAWLAVDERRGGRFAMYCQGFGLTRISNHAVEAIWNSYTTVEDCIAYTYEENGHEFLVFNFLAGNATWVYDPIFGPANGWHQRGYWNGSDIVAQLQAFHAYVNLNSGALHYVGDRTSGNVYIQSLTTYTDNGTSIHRVRVAPHISAEQTLQFYHRFQLDMETGNGAIDPILDWSDDGGHTFGNYAQPPSFGSPPSGAGQYGFKVVWTPLGSSFDRVFMVTITDPVKVAIVNAYIDVTSGINAS